MKREDYFRRQILLFGLIVITWSSYIHSNFIVRILLKSSLVAGIYFGFPMTLSMGYTHLQLIAICALWKGEKEIQETRAKPLGFIVGKGIIFVSLYLYGPLTVAGPHIITVLGLPYLFINFFLTNNKNSYYRRSLFILNQKKMNAVKKKKKYGKWNRVFVKNLRVWQTFLKQILIQLLIPLLIPFLNNAVFPSPVPLRLPTIFMFQCQSKIRFLLGICIGWLIGSILLMESVLFIFIWIHKNFIHPNGFIPPNSKLAKNPLVIELRHRYVYLRNHMDQVITILVAFFFLASLGRIASPIFTIKLKNITASKKKKEGQIETNDETEEEEDPYQTAEIQVTGKEKTEDEFDPQFVDGNEENSKFASKKEERWESLRKNLFDINQWYRPLRYIKNSAFENAVRNEMSHYFFYPCQSDGKERISFTYSPSLATFFEMIEKKMSLFQIEKLSSDELFNNWNYRNEQKKQNLSNELRNRVEALDKGSLSLNKLEKKTRFCNDESQEEYLPESYDPLLSGAFRGRIKGSIEENSTTNLTEKIWMNKLHLILMLNELEAKSDKSNGKSISKEIGYLFNLINEFASSNKSFEAFTLFLDSEEGKMNLEIRRKVLKLLFDRILLDPPESIKNSAGLKEISKQVPRWPYKLVDALEHEEDVSEDKKDDYEICLRKYKRIILFDDTPEEDEEDTDKQKKGAEDADKQKKDAEDADKQKKDAEDAEGTDKHKKDEEGTDKHKKDEEGTDKHKKNVEDTDKQKKDVEDTDKQKKKRIQRIKEKNKEPTDMADTGEADMADTGEADMADTDEADMADADTDEEV
ncbi:Protein TIC 214, partial [Linum grandiflorum]